MADDNGVFKANLDELLAHLGGAMAHIGGAAQATTGLATWGADRGLLAELDLSPEDYVQRQLTAAIKLTMDERRKAAAYYRKQGMTQREIGALLGVTQTTVGSDLRALEKSFSPPDENPRYDAEDDDEDENLFSSVDDDSDDDLTPPELPPQLLDGAEANGAGDDEPIPGTVGAVLGDDLPLPRQPTAAERMFTTIVQASLVVDHDPQAVAQAAARYSGHAAAMYLGDSAEIAAWHERFVAALGHELRRPVRLVAAPVSEEEG